MIDTSHIEQDDPVNTTSRLNAGDIRFPISNQNEIPIWMTIRRRKYQKVDLQSNATLAPADGARDISLPLPINLQRRASAQWGQEDMGVWGNFVRENLGPGVTQNMKNLAAGKMPFKMPEVSSAADLANVGRDVINSVFNERTKEIGANMLKHQIIDAALSSDTFRTFGAYTGYARNPHKALFFTSGEFRAYAFNYELAAKNYDEAKAIKDMVKELQIGMSPDFESPEELKNNLYTYPDIFEIDFTKPAADFLFDIAPCVLTSLDVEYLRNGPAFIGGPNGEKIPAIVTLTMQFQETVILTRRDYSDTSKNY